MNIFVLETDNARTEMDNKRSYPGKTVNRRPKANKHRLSGSLLELLGFVASRIFHLSCKSSGQDR